MIVQMQVDGQEAIVAFLDDDFNPVDQEEATIAKVIFDDGSNKFVDPTSLKTEIEP